MTMPGKSFHLRVVSTTCPSGGIETLVRRRRWITAIECFLVLACCLALPSHLRADTQSFTNAAAITIPDSGAGTPYPSAINVAGMIGTVSNVTVTLHGLSHTWVSDVDVLLVGPAGQKVLIFSDVGDGFNATNVTVTLSDAAASVLPASGSFATRDV